MKRTFFALCAGFLLLSFPAKAISFWEGTAVASNYGEFPSAGLYAACSSFPRNALVEVTNLENSKTVQVLITRPLDNPGVFIALSPEAAAQIMIQIGMVSRVKVALPQTGMDNLLRYDSPGMSQDPDLNPQALVDRERLKGDSGLAFAPNPTPEPRVPEVAIVKPTEKPKTPVFPVYTSAPDAISSLIQEPEGNRLAVKPKNLPETPLSEKTPSALEARTTTPATDVKPEALARLSSKDARSKGLPSYNLNSPELESEKVSAPAVAQVLEASTLKKPEATRLTEKLAIPDLEGREKPESASLARLKAPADGAQKIASNMASPELAGTSADQKAEAYEIARKAGKQDSDQLKASLAMPSVEETGKDTASVEEMLVVSKKPGSHIDISSLALADPLLEEKPEDSTLREVDERLLVGRKNPSEVAISLADPEILEKTDDGKLLSADERLLASKKAPTDNAVAALADPELGHPAEDASKLSSVDERWIAAKRAIGPEAAFNKADPAIEEVSIAKAEENLPPEALAAQTAKPRVKDQGKMAVVMAGPELAAEEKIVGPEVAAAARPEEPKGAHDLLAFEKASPELAKAEEERPVIKTVETPIEKPIEKPIVKTEKPKLEIVESFRKGAEALTALNALRMDGLSKGVYYVQVGVYRSGSGAAQAVKGLTPDYPLSYQEVEAKENNFYRVYVGPLRKDESGVVMVKLKSMGFKDAFVKKGD
jgi:hypothetical protein